MKSIFLAFTILITFQISYAQSEAPAQADKAVVYFVRTSGLGAFTYFDGDNVIGKFSGQKYLRYECPPGEHIFWAQSQNKSFVEANLEAGNIYVVHILSFGTYDEIVILQPIQSGAIPHRVTRLLSKRTSESFTKAELNKIQMGKKKVLARAKVKIERMKEKGKDLKKLTARMAVDQKDLVLMKEKKKKS